MIDVGEWGRIFGPEQLVQSTKAASTSQMGRFETKWLATRVNLAALADGRPLSKGATAQSRCAAA